MPGALVLNRGDAPAEVTTTTDSASRFRLVGVYEALLAVPGLRRKVKVQLRPGVAGAIALVRVLSGAVGKFPGGRDALLVDYNADGWIGLDGDGRLAIDTDRDGRIGPDENFVLRTVMVIGRVE